MCWSLWSRSLWPGGVPGSDRRRRQDRRGGRPALALLHHVSAGVAAHVSNQHTPTGRKLLGLLVDHNRRIILVARWSRDADIEGERLRRVLSIDRAKLRYEIAG